VAGGPLQGVAPASVDGGSLQGTAPASVDGGSLQGAAPASVGGGSLQGAAPASQEAPMQGNFVHTGHAPGNFRHACFFQARHFP
jgi:hypothetical protein